MCVWKIQHEGMCQEANTARGKAECCICLETPPNAVFFIYTRCGALTITCVILTYLFYCEIAATSSWSWYDAQQSCIIFHLHAKVMLHKQQPIHEHVTLKMVPQGPPSCYWAVTRSYQVELRWTYCHDHHRESLLDLLLKSAICWVVPSSWSTSVPSTRPHSPLTNRKCFIWNFHIVQFNKSSLSIDHLSTSAILMSV